MAAGGVSIEYVLNRLLSVQTALQARDHQDAIQRARDLLARIDEDLRLVQRAQI